MILFPPKFLFINVQKPWAIQGALIPEPELSEEERAALEEKRRRRAERRQKNIFRQLYSGEILTKDEVRALYPYLMVLGMTFLTCRIAFGAAQRRNDAAHRRYKVPSF